MIYFFLILLFIIGQRLVELYIAHKNEQWMLARGGIEVGNDHYKLFILLHVMFFVMLIYEVSTFMAKNSLTFNMFFFSLFLMMQIGRVWCIASLGKFWNTKIIVLPKVIMIKKGPYKYVKHPNYVIVFIELFVIPATFGAYMTAMIFPDITSIITHSADTFRRSSAREKSALILWVL